jgi:hypothetical protein
MSAFPTSPAPSTIVVRSAQPTRVSVAHSMKRQRRGGTVQAWGFKLSWRELTRAAFAPIWGFSIGLRGQYSNCTFVPTLVGTRQTAGTGTPLVKTTTATGRSVPVKGMDASQVLGKIGDFLKFANHTKVYMLTADATANGSGEVTIAIEPALYALVAADEALTLDAVPFTVLLASDVREYEVRGGREDGPFDFELEMVEDV